MSALAEKARARLTSPNALYGILDSATKSLTTDESLDGIKPLVLNGTGTSGQAAKVAEQLRAAGFPVATTGNAPEPVSATTVSHPAGFEQQAAALAARLTPQISPEAGQDASPALVTLTIGSDYQGLRG